MGFLLRLAAAAAALWVAVAIVPGISFTGPWYQLFLVALVFGVINAIVRPILTLLTCPFIIVTLGLFLLVLNALMLLLTSSASGALGLNFHVSGFWPAFFGGIVIAIVSALLNVFIGDSDREEPTPV